jgi:prolyl oligopeptidase
VTRDNKVWFHRVGTPQSEDIPVFHRPDHPDWGYYPLVSDEGRYLLITAFRGVQMKTKVFLRDLWEPHAMAEELVGDFTSSFFFIGNDGPTLFFRTDLGATRGRVVAIDVRPGSTRELVEIIPQAEGTLRWISLVGNLIAARYLENVQRSVKFFDLRGSLVREAAFPQLGTASGFRGGRKDAETFYTFSGLVTPPSIYRYDLITGRSTLLRRAEVDFDPGRLEVKQVHYRSQDGTAIPMFLAHRKDLALDGTHPTLLYGYGGFGTPMLPTFSPDRVAWMEWGGVFAMPNLRGGSEFGSHWHEAGLKTKRQTVFDDFIAAARWLIDKKYTNPSKLAVKGSSNGGLLVGAVMTQRPDLFGACLVDAGVLDMLRFHLFTAGKLWTVEYGSVEREEEFRALHAYSPYHNIKPEGVYPPTLITAADTDERVVPLHSYKFAAALQHAQGGAGPILLRVERKGAHGASGFATKTMGEIADQYAFLVRNLGMELVRK